VFQKTIAHVLDENDGIGPGFDFLRLALAIIILLAHCSGISGTHGFLSSVLRHWLDVIWPHVQAQTAAAISAPVDNDAVTGLARPFTLSHVPMFFALSGFLVTGSALRTKRIMPFVMLRFFRIFPALLVELTISAVVLGAVFTALPLSDYYGSVGFWRYFGNMVGIVELKLPGVLFAGSHIADIVNANLWTLPAEFHSYAITAALMFVTVFFNRKIMLAAFVIITAALVVGNTFLGFQVTTHRLGGDVSVYYFFAGSLFYLWRDKIPFSFGLFAASLIGCYILMFSTRTVYIYPALLVYVTVFIGLCRFPKNKILQSGDYSYGIYLYGFPITQALVATFPALRENLLGLSIAGVSTTVLFAFLSWHLIEKRFLRLRKRFSPASAKIATELHPEAFKPV
jgi:peptidoglycan/LPS O-acetylase OafA/YrhL